MKPIDQQIIFVTGLQEAQANLQAYDREARRKLRQLSEALIGLQVAQEEKR